MRKATKAKTTQTTSPTNQKAKIRTMAEIQADYNQLCAQAGSYYFQKTIAEEDLRKLHPRLHLLNQEAAIIQAEELKKKTAESKSAATSETSKEAEASI